MKYKRILVYFRQIFLNVYKILAIEFYLLMQMILEHFQYSILAIFSQRKKGRSIRPIRKRAGALKNQKADDKKLQCSYKVPLEEKKKGDCLSPGSNRGPLVCETSVMTNYTTQTRQWVTNEDFSINVYKTGYIT